MYDRYYQNRKAAAHLLYTERPFIYSPFFKDSVFLSPEGFEHLSVSATGERSREEQIQRFMLLPLGLYVLETATKLRAYRRRFISVVPGHPVSKKKKMVQWWTFAELFRKERITVRVVVRKVGNGRLHFWSVMLHTNDVGLGTPKLPTVDVRRRPGSASLVRMTDVASTTNPG